MNLYPAWFGPDWRQNSTFEVISYYLTLQRRWFWQNFETIDVDKYHIFEWVFFFALAYKSICTPIARAVFPTSYFMRLRLYNHYELSTIKLPKNARIV